MKLLVCGGRNYEDEHKLNSILDSIHAWSEIGLLIHGDAGRFYDYPDSVAIEPGLLPGFWVGADKLASQWARNNKVPEKRYKPDWKQYGRKAGPIRNQQMLDEQHPDLVIAFPGGRGTADMVKRAKAGGYKVCEIAE